MQLSTRFSIFALLALVLVAFEAAAAQQDSAWKEHIHSGDDAMAKRQYAEAEKSYRQALEIAQTSWKKDARTAVSLIKVAESCNQQSKHDEAEELADRSVSEIEADLRAHKPKRNSAEEYYQQETSAAILDKAGDIFAANQHYPGAENFYRRLIVLRESQVETKPPSTSEDFVGFFVQTVTSARAKLANADDKLADLYFRERKFGEAAVIYAKVAKIAEDEYGTSKPPVAFALTNLATCYAAETRYDEAEPLYRRAVAIYEQSSQKASPEMVTALENYSLVLKKMGREAEAQPIDERAQAIRDTLKQNK